MTVQVVKGADGFDRRAFSAEDVRRMVEIGIFDEEDPIELVGGELLQMSPKGIAHDRTRDLIASALVRGSATDINVSVEGTLQVGQDILIEPDILVYPWSAEAPSQVGYRTLPGQAVLLAVEIARSSLRYDIRRKAPLYAAYGVRDYWIVDLTTPQILVYREPGGGGYGGVRSVAPEEAVVPLAPELGAISIRLADLL